MTYRGWKFLGAGEEINATRRGTGALLPTRLDPSELREPPGGRPEPSRPPEEEVLEAE